MFLFELFDSLFPFVTKSEVSDGSLSWLWCFLILLYIAITQQPCERPIHALSVMFGESIDE